MAKFWTDILVPVALAGAVAAQTLGVELTRASRLRASFPSAQIDTTKVHPDSLKIHPDSLKAKADTLDEDFDFFGEAADTTPKITARDTMKIPDSLKVTDPFLYQWYVATKDSYTHRVVIDSLKQAGDSLIWPQVDSLFLADSTYQAQLAWEAKWNTMSKAEKKRWTYEHVELPRIMHRQDSILT